MTWEQLEELEETGLFDIQSHSFWHPNFRVEKRRLAPDEYRKFVNTQLVKSKTILEQKLGAKIDLLSWPFGIYDEELITAARNAGYTAGFTLDRRSASKSDDVMALPRFLMNDRMRGKAFESLISTGRDKREASRTAR
jgi:peptidoglycan/xylan/chitin deacetylase (PgdA/CDA1 family)